MKLSDLLRDLATHYRQFGDIPVLIETQTEIVPLSRTDVDIFNISDSTTLILEVEGLPTPKPDDLQIPQQRTSPEQQTATKRRTAKRPPTTAQGRPNKVNNRQPAQKA